MIISHRRSQTQTNLLAARTVASTKPSTRDPDEGFDAVLGYRYFLVLSIVLLFVLVAMHLPEAYGAQVTLAWDKNPEPDIAGYKMHYGTSSGSYDFSVDVGSFTGCTISGLAEGTTYYFAATAYNTIGESNFSQEITYTPGSETETPPDSISEVIIDNGGQGTAFTGSWEASTCPNPYGAGSLCSWDQGAAYTFEAEVDGASTVFLWWTEHATMRCTNVPVKIYDDSTVLDTVEVNQQANGGQWNELGEYVFNNGIARVVVASEGGCSTGVDAMKLVSNNDRSAPPSIYQITASAGSGGSISPAGEVTLSAGSSAIYTIQPSANYRIADVKLDGNSVGAVTSYTFQNVSADHTITASFDAEVTQSSSGKGRGWRKWRRRR